jgi:acetylornithine deacetylase/succinyl-diaminopimelate desuccinylase-like protein
LISLPLPARHQAKYAKYVHHAIALECAQFGPIGSGEHTADESVDVASVKFVARVLETAARRLCA